MRVKIFVAFFIKTVKLAIEKIEKNHNLVLLLLNGFQPILPTELVSNYLVETLNDKLTRLATPG